MLILAETASTLDAVKDWVSPQVAGFLVLTVVFLQYLRRRDQARERAEDQRAEQWMASETERTEMWERHIEEQNSRILDVIRKGHEIQTENVTALREFHGALTELTAAVQHINGRLDRP